MMFDRLLAARPPHFVREYRNLVSFLARDAKSEFDLAERAVGGGYEKAGAKQAELVLETAPKGPFRLIDVGCGSGRAAFALRHVERLDYLGTDVVPALLDFARKKVARPDWRFEEVTSLAIPAEDASADIVLFMSVFTHLKPGEPQMLLAEAARVLKPGGAVICSYLDRNHPQHTKQFRPPWRQRLARLLRRDVMISFTTEQTLSEQMKKAGFAIERSLKAEAGFGHFVLIGRKGSAG
ncbi:MAG: methyltransferase domain-containing protein [Alphaproteobacteria bacterium]|nr:methyltransferase domain-containing protein [Alphaproteobacteria bacterium]